MANAELYLQHRTSADELKILQDGFLKSSSKTGISHWRGEDKSIWIYTRINTDLDRYDGFADFYLDHSLLLHTKFILQVGWQGEEDIKTRDIIDGTKLTKKKLRDILLAFKNMCVEKYKITCILRGYKDGSLYSNEILILDDIDLHKYLRKMKLSKDPSSKAIRAYLKENYSNVQV
jgi:hypothetical protein